MEGRKREGEERGDRREVSKKNRRMERRRKLRKNWNNTKRRKKIDSVKRRTKGVLRKIPVPIQLLIRNSKVTHTTDRKRNDEKGRGEQRHCQFWNVNFP